MSHFLPHEEFPVKGTNFLSKLRILLNMWLPKITLFRAKYLSKSLIFPHSKKRYPTLVPPSPALLIK